MLVMIFAIMVTTMIIIAIKGGNTQPQPTPTLVSPKVSPPLPTPTASSEIGNSGSNRTALLYSDVLKKTPVLLSFLAF